jgi:hypothetical protein
VARKNDGTAVAWGGNANGQLGDGSTTQRLYPTAVTGLTGVAAVAAGTYHTVARKSDGSAVAWGGNANGQLGDGSTTQRLYPTAITGLAGVAAVAAGAVHTVALKNDGTVVSWGDNSSGQLGDGTVSATPHPAPAPVPGINLDTGACLAKVGTVCYGTLGAAYRAVPSGTSATILARTGTHAESIVFDRDVAVTLQGGYDSSFTSVTGSSVLQLPEMNLLSGSLTVGNSFTVNQAPL